MWRPTIVAVTVGALLCGCGSSGSQKQSRAALKAEMKAERKDASFEPPPKRVIAAAGATPAARDATAKAELKRAAADVQRYHAAHKTFALGRVSNLHKLDPKTALVDFFDGRQTSFYLAVRPPATKTTWRWNFDHNKSKTACKPAGGDCPASKRW